MEKNHLYNLAEGRRRCPPRCYTLKKEAILFFCFEEGRWWRQRRRSSRCKTFGFQLIAFEGMHQFNAKFTEGSRIIKYRPSLN